MDFKPAFDGDGCGCVTVTIGIVASYIVIKIFLAYLTYMVTGH